MVRIFPAAAVVTAVVNLPYLVMRYIRDYAPNNTIHTHLQGIFRLTDGLYTLNPLIYFRQSGILLILGLLSIFLLWKHSREDESLRLLLWGNIALWLLLFNPLTFPPLMKAIAYLVMRLKIAVPVSLLSAVLVKVLWDRARGRRTGMSAWSAAAGWAAVIVFFGYQLAVTPKDFAYGRSSGTKLKNSCLNISDVYEQIETHVPEGEVIASDPITSYCIPAFSDQFIICTNSQHSVPNDSTALERISDCRAIFSPLSSLRDMAHVLGKYESRYIVVNGRIPLSIGTMYWKPDRAMARATFGRLQSYPTYFENVYTSDDAALFRVRDEFMSAHLPGGEGAFTETHVGEAVSIDDLSGMTPSGISGIRIKDVRPAAQSAARGGELEVEIDWVLEEPVDYRGFVVHVRFDTDFEKGGLYRESYGKIYRKGLEKREGLRYRFRVDHLPFNGIVTPDLWPTLRVIEDSVPVSIPSDIATGEYVISIRMSEATHYPNFSMRDLLTDDDSYDGPDIARIFIK
jgi:hypothetical protein